MVLRSSLTLTRKLIPTWGYSVVCRVVLPRYPWIVFIRSIVSWWQASFFMRTSFLISEPFVLSSDGGCILGLLLPREIDLECILWECNNDWHILLYRVDFTLRWKEGFILDGWQLCNLAGVRKVIRWGTTTTCKYAVHVQHFSLVVWSDITPRCFLSTLSPQNLKRMPFFFSTLEWECDSSDSLNLSAWALQSNSCKCWHDWGGHKPI